MIEYDVGFVLCQFHDCHNHLVIDTDARNFTVDFSSVTDRSNDHIRRWQ